VTETGILAVLQARMSSTRLPGKSLIPVLGQPMLLRQVERLRRCREVDRLAVATSSDASDDELAALCASHDLACFRGSLEDVLDRFVQAARLYRPVAVIRLTGDCPLTDPGLIDEVVRFFRHGGYDYVSNCFPPTYPDGLDVEVMRYACLEEAAKEAVLPSHREHVTPFLRAHPERYRLGNYESPVDRSALRWTVDEPEDLEFVRLVYGRLYPVNPNFTTEDILAVLAREPHLGAINARFGRNEGSARSKLADRQYLKGLGNVGTV